MEIEARYALKDILYGEWEPCIASFMSTHNHMHIIFVKSGEVGDDEVRRIDVRFESVSYIRGEIHGDPHEFVLSESNNHHSLVSKCGCFEISFHSISEVEMWPDITDVNWKSKLSDAMSKIYENLK